MQAVEDAFIARFGPWAGWAHNTLFISELASQQENLPEHLRSKGAAKSKTSKKAAKKPEKTEVLGQKSVEDEGAVARTVVTVSRKRQGVKKERGEMQDMQDSDMEPVRNKRKTSGKGVSNVQAEDDLSTEIKTELSVETAMQDDQEALGFVTSRTGAKGEFNKGQSKQQQRVSKRLQMQTKSSSAAAVAAVDHVLNETASALGKESA